MIESEHWMTPLKNRCGNYGSLMKTRPREIPLVGQRARAGVPSAGASPAPTIHDRIVSFARKSNGQSYRDMVGATLAVALKNAGAITRRAVALACLCVCFPAAHPPGPCRRQRAYLRATAGWNKEKCACGGTKCNAANGAGQ